MRKSSSRGRLFISVSVGHNFPQEATEVLKGLYSDLHSLLESCISSLLVVHHVNQLRGNNADSLWGSGRPNRMDGEDFVGFPDSTCS